ncbi:amidohydrolase family protein [Tsukamurella sp. NPDC003166]|uniref:amidohydrolase family protein n=1 Tax=Tsukamurella sp. NPDC003166 TaxID=3154444 RepID=UPI0033B0C322
MSDSMSAGPTINRRRALFGTAAVASTAVLAACAGPQQAGAPSSSAAPSGTAGGGAGLVDVHAHFVTDDYIAAARSVGHEKPDGMPAWPAWNIDKQLADMDRRAIRKAVLSISSPGVHFGDDARAAELARTVNDRATAEVRAHPTRLDHFASLPLPDVDAAVVEARRALSAGAIGVIVMSNAGGQYLGDAALEPLWAELASRRAIVLVHPTSPPGWERTALGRPRPMLEFMFDTTRSVVDLGFSGVLARHPELRIVVPHSGATLPILSERIGLFQKGIGVPAAEPWAKTLRKLWFDTAGTPFPTAIPALASQAGTERIVYGSDSCWTPDAAIDAVLKAIDEAAPPTGARNWRELAAANAEQLLRRD